MTVATIAPTEKTIAVTWTDAPVIRITAKIDFPEYGVCKGEVVYLVRITDQPGAYYIVRWTGTAWSCPCDGNAVYKRTCKHIKATSCHCKGVAQRQKDRHDVGKIWDRLQAKKAWEQEQRELAARVRDEQIRAHVDALVAQVNAELGAPLVRRGIAPKPVPSVAVLPASSERRATAVLQPRAFGLPPTWNELAERKAS
jgi:hypothetical protein